MQTPVTLTIAAIAGSGPKATAVQFLKTEDGIRLWAWIPNATAAGARPGMVATGTVNGYGRIETTYVHKVTNAVVELKVPKQQVFFSDDVVIDAPEQEPYTPPTFTLTEAARKYAEAYDAKRANVQPAADADDAF